MAGVGATGATVYNMNKYREDKREEERLREKSIPYGIAEVQNGYNQYFQEQDSETREKMQSSVRIILEFLKKGDQENSSTLEQFTSENGEGSKPVQAYLEEESPKKGGIAHRLQLLQSTTRRNRFGSEINSVEAESMLRAQNEQETIQEYARRLIYQVAMIRDQRFQSSSEEETQLAA